MTYVNDEAGRIEAFRRYDILDTELEGAFDDLARLAAQLCEVPIALVSLIDADRQWLKALVGLGVDPAPRENAFCDHAVRHKGLFVVTDARVDPRFASDPLVTSAAGVRFYAGT